MFKKIYFSNKYMLIVGSLKVAVVRKYFFLPMNYYKVEIKMLKVLFYTAYYR